MCGRLKVLVVDDEPSARAALAAAVASLGYECRSACDGVEALRLHQAEPTDVILSDWQMPRMDGLELCRRTRLSDGEQSYTHFVFITALTDREHFRLGMEAGADDYLTKPIDLDELAARLASASRVVAAQRRLSVMNASLRRDSEASFNQARLDPLTGACNRLRLTEDLQAIWAIAGRYGQRYSAVIFDIDWFKAYNDAFGHLRGDEALHAVAETMRGELRRGDMLYRYGGEEFLLLLPNQSTEDALVAADRVRQAVEQRAIKTVAAAGVVTLSAGVAELDVTVDREPSTWIGRADEALYRAKAAGRNRSAA